MRGKIKKPFRAIKHFIKEYRYRRKDGKVIRVPAHFRTYYSKISDRKKDIAAIATGTVLGGVSYKIARKEGSSRKDAILRFALTAPIGTLLSRELLRDFKKPSKQDIEKALVESGELAIILTGTYLGYRRQRRRRLAYIVSKTRSQFGEVASIIIEDFFRNAPSKIIKYAYAIFKDGDINDIFFDKRYNRLIIVRSVGNERMTKYIFENEGNKWVFYIQTDKTEVM